MIKLGLIGKDISHSKSKQMYQDILDTEVDYHLLDYGDGEDIPSLTSLFDLGFNGLSVTYPYKKQFLDAINIEDEKVRDLKAVNCLKLSNGIVEATNTDYLAAKHLLNTKYKSFTHFIILGSGNMANVFKLALEEVGLSYKILSRKSDGDLNQLNYSEIVGSVSRETVIINCCSREFIFLASLPEGVTFWDMNYSFMEHASIQTKGVNYIEGLDLLKWQAKFALSFWDIPLPRNS